MSWAGHTEQLQFLPVPLPESQKRQMLSLPILFNASQSKGALGPNAYNQAHCLPYHGRGKWKTGGSGFTKRDQAFVFASFAQ